MVHRPQTGTKKLLTSRIALKDIPSDLYLSSTWFTPILNNGATVLTTQQYDLRPQSVSDLTNEVDGKYIISVVELQQEGEYYSLSKDDLTAILPTLQKRPPLLLRKLLPRIKVGSSL